jgi:hypothetical protein
MSDPVDAAIDAAVSAFDAETIVRCQWLAGQSAETTREALGGVGIGVVGSIAQALGLPARDADQKLLAYPIGSGSTHPLRCKDGEV